MNTKTQSKPKMASAEDLARAEVANWEMELEPEERSNISIRRGLIESILRWRRESGVSGDYMTAERCSELLVSMGEES